MDFRSSSCGKEMGFGSPPAKEITLGSEAAFKMPLTKDGGAPEGTKRQREAGVIWLQKSGFFTDSAHILPAAGGQNAITAALGAFFDIDDKIGTEPMTYPGVKTAAKLFGIQLLPVQSQACPRLFHRGFGLRLFMCRTDYTKNW